MDMFISAINEFHNNPNSDSTSIKMFNDFFKLHKEAGIRSVKINIGETILGSSDALCPSIISPILGLKTIEEFEDTNKFFTCSNCGKSIDILNNISTTQDWLCTECTKISLCKEIKDFEVLFPVLDSVLKLAIGQEGDVEFITGGRSFHMNYGFSGITFYCGENKNGGWLFVPMKDYKQMPHHEVVKKYMTAIDEITNEDLEITNVKIPSYIFYRDVDYLIWRYDRITKWHAEAFRYNNSHILLPNGSAINTTINRELFKDGPLVIYDMGLSEEFHKVNEFAIPEAMRNFISKYRDLLVFPKPFILCTDEYKTFNIWVYKNKMFVLDTDSEKSGVTSINL